MENLVPGYLRKISHITRLFYENDGAYSLELSVEIQGQKDFIPFLSVSECNSMQKQELEWLKEFKKKYKALWEKGYDLTSKLTEEGIIYGATKNGKYIDLALYKPSANYEILMPIVVKLQSKEPKTEFIIFNSNLHGYDAITTQQKFPLLPHKYKKKSRCRQCGSEFYRVYISIHNTGKIDLLNGESDNTISDVNWVDAFDWFTIDLVCSNCGKKIKKWFEIETM